MLFPLVGTETDITEDRNDNRELPDHKACMPQGENHRESKSNEKVGVQLPGHGCENVKLHPGLVEISLTLSEHDPLNPLLGEKGLEPAKHI